MGSTGSAGGSVGVNTGRLSSTQLGALLTEGRGATGTISVDGKIPARIFVDNEGGRGGVTIDMTSVGQAKREAFIRALRGRTNTDNSQRAYDRAYNQAIAMGRPTLTAQRMAEEAREQVFRNVLQGVIRRNDRFSGIKIRSRITRNRPING